MNFKKISIITPNFNGGQYLEDAIRSIISQNYPNLEYIIIDGGSTDKSIDIIKKYESYITYWVSEPDKGMYYALSKGFKLATGEIMGWLNSDDLLHPKSLFTINEVFHLKDVKWIQGIPTTIDEYGRTVAVSEYKKWSKYDYWQGKYEWIQQESTYWHIELWEKSGSYIDTTIKFAGDFELWNRFFKYEKLYSLKALIGGFRIRTNNQISLDHLKEYHEEAKMIISKNNLSKKTENIVKNINKLRKLLLILSKTRVLNIFAFTNRIEKKINKLLDYPETIYFNRELQKYYKTTYK